MRIQNMLQIRSALIATLLCFLAVPGLPAVAQSSALPSLTSEQQRMLQNLPSSQRDALARRYLGISQTSNAPVIQQGLEEEFEPEFLLGTESQLKELPKLTAYDTVVLISNFEVAPSPGSSLARFRTNLNSRNPYVLDEEGRIALPGLLPVTLAGLTELQAQLRLNAEPGLAGIKFELFRLPVEDLTSPQLEYFGYSFFQNRSSSGQLRSFQPIPRNYSIGPGDTVRVTMYGNAAAVYELQVDRDGVLMFPELGPITAAGLTLEALRKEVKATVDQQKIGTQVSVTLNELRSVRVFLVGDVKEPGAYTVSPFASVTHVLTQGGGVSDHGSLRNVELKRNNRIVSRLDLYDMLLRGDVSRDRRVSDGDVIFVPPVGPRVSITGEVQRPAIYEMKGALSVQQALAMAGGLSGEGLESEIRIERTEPNAGLSVIDVGSFAMDMAVTSGDVIIVPGVSKQLDGAVSVRGHVFRRGLQEWRPGIRLSDVLSGPRDMRPQADVNYVLIKRQVIPNGDISVFSVDLQSVWLRVPGSNDPELIPRDEIIVFNQLENREVYLQPILDRLGLQAGAGAPMPMIRVIGEVKFPGDYPLEQGMTIADLVRAGGGLSEAAYEQSAELTRYSYDGGGQLSSELFAISLGETDFGSSGGNDGLALQPFDSLNVKRIPDWGEESYIELTGEVAFPGRYSINRNENLSSVLQRAGGYTDSAFLEGSVFTREILRLREKEQLAALTQRMESDLAAMALSDPGQAESASVGRSLLTQLRSAKPTGRLVIDLNALERGRAELDVLVRDGDALHIPKRSQEVTVIGEVQYSTSHLWQRGLIRNDYVTRSGGLTVKADRKRVYVVRANGEVIIGNRSQFFARSGSTDIRPGDTIVVPIHTDRVKPLLLWTSATQILYNLAIAAAAANGF